jgi:hypothetical protein
MDVLKKLLTGTKDKKPDEPKPENKKLWSGREYADIAERIKIILNPK